MTGEASGATSTMPADFRMLDQVDTETIGRRCVPPRDLVVSRDAAAPLQHPAPNRVAHVRRGVHDWTERGHVGGVQPLGVDAVETVRVEAAHRRSYVAQ